MRGSIVHDMSPGRSADAGDYIYFDLWTHQKITPAETKALTATPRPMPPNQVLGYVFDEGDAGGGEGGALGVGGPVGPPSDLGDEKPGLNQDHPAARSDRDVAVEFLREAGFEDHELRGNWTELVSYVRGVVAGVGRQSESVSSRTRSRGATSSSGTSRGSSRR